MSSHSRYAARAPPPVPLEDISLGNHDLRKAIVDCKYVAEHTQWGTWQEKSAGLLRLEITLHQPTGYELAYANVYLGFSTADTQENAADKPHVVYLYPRRLCGKPRYKHSTKSKSFNPSANAAGFASFELGGKQAASDWTKQYHWQFKGTTLCDETDRQTYTRVGWTWEANKLSEQSEESEFHSSLIFRHHDKPFKTTVVIDGRFAKGLKKYIFRRTQSRPQIREFNPDPVVQAGNVDLSAQIEGIKAEIKKANNTGDTGQETGDPGPSEVPGDENTGDEQPTTAADVAMGATEVFASVAAQNVVA